MRRVPLHRGQSEAANAARQTADIGVIARQPGTARFGKFSFGSNGVPGMQTAVLFLETDSIVTMPCLSEHGKAVREHQLSDAITVLGANCQNLVIYLDAGAADALSARDAALYLRKSGVGMIQGVSLDATHFDGTLNEIRYGREISRPLGGKHFVINTGENGPGPQRPRDIVHQSVEVLCNPRARLGPLPTATTGYGNVDTVAWTSNPGESGGQRVPEAPPIGAHRPAYATSLVPNADFKVR